MSVTARLARWYINELKLIIIARHSGDFSHGAAAGKRNILTEDGGQAVSQDK